MSCFSFRKLEQIDRRQSGLLRFPEDAFRHRSKLTAILLDGNHIKELPRNISQLNKLERLTVADNELEELPAEVFRLSRLLEFNLRNNSLTELPTAIRNCSKLRILDVSANGINSLPDSVADLSVLTSLCINDASLHRLPQELAGLKQLQVLEARDNHLKYLPQSISTLRQLRKLDVGCNDIVELPDGIGNLALLEELWLDTNDMESLPVEVGALEQLKVADFSDNHIEALPEDLKGLVNLTDLTLSNNTLLALPDSIGSLKSLSQLKCENNQLHVLPDTIGRLKNLKELFLTDNMLEHLPSTIGELEKLTTLYVDRNHLLSVPPELCTCQRLSIMNFRQNSLTRIPPDYGMISTLRVVDLCNNMLDTLPSSFLHLNLKALWLSDNQSKPLMELQMETDSVTKEELLTCILLPQSTGQSQSLENLLVGTNGSSFGDPDATSRASQVTGSSHDRTTRVAFAADTQDRTGDTDVENQAKLQRHPTPYIKDLRAKAKRHRDGRKSPDGSKRSSTGSLVPSESAATPPVVRAEDEADKSGKAHKGVAFSEDTKEAPDGASGSRIAAVMRHDTPHPSTLAQRMEEAKSTEEGLLDNNLDETQAAVPAVVSFEATEHSSDKHVSFVEEDDVNAAAEDVEKEKEPLSKLSRKDTPKPKQYNPDDSKLRRRDTPRNYGTPTYGMSSPATAEILEEAEEEEEEEAKLEQLMEKKAPPAEEYDTIVAVLVRTNTGLGFSISGGIGCNPRYRVDNEYVYVTKIAPGGLADTEGSMKPGDQIVSVNDVDYMDGISHEKAVETLKKTSGAVRFVLRRPVPTRNMGPQVLITSASVEKEDEFDDRQTETPPTPEESKRPLAIEEEKEPDDSDTRVVSITRSGQSLGMTIVGGSDTSPLPFGTQLLDDEGIYISKIVPGGLADQCGKLEIGDQIVSVNGQRLESQSHGTAVACLVGADLVSMVIKRVGPPPGIQTVTFSKADDEKLGLSIRGGSGAAKSGNPNNEKDEGVFISKINAGGAASRCGEFRVGQRIIDVNGNTLLGATHHEAVRVLKSVGKDVKFIVCDGYEPPEDASLLDASLISKASVDVPAVDVPPVIVETPSTGEAVVAVPTEPETAAEETRAPEPTDEAVSQPVADEPLTDNQPKEQETTSPPVDEPTAVSGAEGVEELETAAPATAEPETTAEEETPAPEGQQEVEESAADTPADEPAKSEEEAPAEDAPAEDAPAEDAPAEDAPSTPAKKAEDGVEIGGHSLRSTPAREARVEEDATPGAAAAADGEEEEESTAAAAAITGDSQPTTPSKKHKKHKKKRHSDAGQAATSGDREHKKHKHKKHKSHDAEK